MGSQFTAEGIRKEGGRDLATQAGYTGYENPV